MELQEALTVTALGMGVVFTGLVLTSLLIVAFSVVPRAFGLRAHGLPPHRAEAAPPEVVAGDPVPPDVVTVIATVLEVERRLSRLGPRGRVSIARGAGRPA